eukprot:PITA_06618
MQEWPHPKTLKSLRGFLGLTGYYRKFVRNYGRIAKPLTQLLKKNAFVWNEEAQQAFTALKNAMCSTPVLALPDFTKSFVIECDASGTGIGAVLMQEGRPLAFTRQQLSGKNPGQSTYEKEMMAILHAVDTWQPYLLGRHFQIRTDHHSLKYFLEQRLSSPQQNKWLAKMLGYDYEIIYKKGKDNSVADALSCQFEEESTLLAISLPIPEWIEEARREWFSHPELSQLISQLQADPNSTKGYSWQDDILRYKDRVVISPTSTFKSRILAEMHSSPIAGHSGFQKTYARTRRSFFWKGMKKDILTFVTECEVCQRHKGETSTHQAHYNHCPFRRQFGRRSPWISLQFFQSLGTNGQTEAINKCLETYLRCFTSEKQHIWVQWLPLAEWWYNTNYHATTKMTPYESVYGQLPPSPTSYLTGCSKVQVMDQLLQHCATMLAHLHENLHQAQNRMKQ